MENIKKSFTLLILLCLASQPVQPMDSMLSRPIVSTVATASLCATLTTLLYFAYQSVQPNVTKALSSVSAGRDVVQSQLVLVRHKIGRGGSVESVKEHGLLNWKTLYERGMIDFKKPSGTFDDRDKVIYFDPRNRGEKYEDVAFPVDPEETKVYNREHRYFNNIYYYKRSELSLKTYLKYLKQAEEMRKDKKQVGFVVHDYITGKPEMRSLEEHVQLERDQSNSGKAKLYGYVPEVIVRRDVIPSEELIFLGDQDA